MATAEVYKYNPRLIPPDELQATFVARQVILEDILNELRARAAAPVNQHFLVIGPRGIGKTNLLLMIRYGVLGDEALARAYLPLQTAEEEYSIAHLRHLFAKTLALAAENAPDDEVKAAAESITGMQDDDQAAEAAIEATRAYSARTGRKLLLLVDNLDLILGDQLRDDAQIGRLRDLLMNESFLVLIGAAPTYFDEVSGYDRPFYNFFRTINLQDLSPEQIVQMLRKRAEWDGNRTILDHLDELPPRIKAVHHLTGGNPRLVLMIYQLCTASELPEVRTAVQALLDDVTPYYKSRLEQLPAQQRRLMDTFARLGRPATPTELAAETRLQVNQVNSILQRLKETGFVTLAPQERRKKTYYMVSERLFRVWHQMRFSTATTRRVQFLIEFIRVWYTPTEWMQEADRLLNVYRLLAGRKLFGDGTRLIEHLGYMAEAAPTAELSDALANEVVVTCLRTRDLKGAEELLEEHRRRYELEGDRDRLATAWFFTGRLRHAQGRPKDEVKAYERAVAARPRYATALYNWGTALGHLADAKTGEGRDVLLREGIEKLRAAVAIEPEKVDALCNLGLALYHLAEGKAAADRAALLREAIERFQAVLAIKTDAATLSILGFALAAMGDLKGGAEREGLYQEAIEKWRAAVAINPDNHEALAHWAIALLLLTHTKESPACEELLATAADRTTDAIACVADMGEKDTLASYHGLLIQITSYRCALAVLEDDLGRARALFGEALDHLPEARKDCASRELSRFFSAVASEGAAAVCSELLDMMRARRMEWELAVLEPFAKAVEYWQKGRDGEVLDRLNPEVREIVEEIIRRGEEPRKDETPAQQAT